jgi:rieske iron-sulfur protein
MFLNGDNDIRVEDLVEGSAPVLVVARDPKTGRAREHEGNSDRAMILLYRVTPEKILNEIRSDTVDGIIAYSALCTHQRCLIKDWDASTNQFVCPCHQSAFDPLQGGRNSGGVKTRDLPQVPLKVRDGKLVVSYFILSWVGPKRL